MVTATQHGQFTADPSGLQHYEPIDAGLVTVAVDDALAHRPDGPAWFWFNGTFAPIQPEDTAESLRHRWSVWRQTWQADTRLFHTLLQVYTQEYKG